MAAPGDSRSLREQREAAEFERNAHVTGRDTVVTGYGGVTTWVEDGVTYHADPTPSPARLERDRERAHQLRTRVRHQRLIRAERRIVGSGCFTRRLPQARRPRPAARRRTVSTRAGPRSSDPDLADDPPGHRRAP